jgi:hypothetical protein
VQPLVRLTPCPASSPGDVEDHFLFFAWILEKTSSPGTSFT